MTEQSRTAAIVVNWNGWPWTERCLADLATSRVPLDVIVVDNASSDESRDRLRKLSSPRVEAILLAANRGYAAALNSGVERARDRGFEFVWLLNNDVQVPRDCHERLQQAVASEPAPTLWTPELRSATGELQHVGGWWARDGSSTRLLPADQMDSAPSEGLWLTGTALFCAASTASLIGSLDESFFAYWEDVDWSFRARRAGVQLRVARGTPVTHLASVAAGGRGSPLSSFLLARNELLFARKHVAPSQRRASLLTIVARQLRWALLLERRGRADAAASVLAGVVAGIAGRSGQPWLTSLPRPFVWLALRRPLVTARYLENAASRLRPAGAACGRR